MRGKRSQQRSLRMTPHTFGWTAIDFVKYGRNTKILNVLTEARANRCKEYNDGKTAEMLSKDKEVIKKKISINELHKESAGNKHLGKI